MAALGYRAYGVALLIALPLAVPHHASAQSAQTAEAPQIAASDSAGSQPRVIRVPDGAPGRVLKFEFCEPGTCDRRERKRWSTHYLEPPPGDVCRLSDVGEALRWLGENRPGWRLAGWGCVSAREQSA
ncbi:MAG TPA: hypothetical protein PK857_11860 [Hyphomicrobium sp.]|nr:hypothetical protein [Hyphomicrobium sp.]HRO50085.1 hypothetical protein [Hyphomicrobium sp.]